jgi:hypothetical protein
MRFRLGLDYGDPQLSSRWMDVKHDMSRQNVTLEIPSDSRLLHVQVQRGAMYTPRTPRYRQLSTSLSNLTEPRLRSLYLPKVYQTDVIQVSRFL